MPINLVTPPTPTAPLTTADYNAQNVSYEAPMAALMNKILHLSEWDTLTVPALHRFTYINHGGSLFQVQNSVYAITDPGVADGRVYIRVIRSGDTLTASFVNSTAGYSWYYVYNGFYHADGSQLLPYVLYLDDYL